jgi:hypothetical protein
MPKISNIQLDTNITSSDKLLGSDEQGNTKNFKVEHLSAFFANNAGSFKHNQNNASAVWTITHNLDLADYLPQVNIKLSGGGSYNNVQAMGVVTYLSKDQLKIEFSTSNSGYAYLKA